MKEIRKIIKEDLPALKEVLDTLELFPSEMLEALMADYFTNPESEDIWFTLLQDGNPISIGYCAPEKLTEGTFNLYAIGVKKEFQGKGFGGDMMEYLENYLKNSGHRILIVETSGSSDFELTRAFYHKKNYTHEATIKEFWKKGDDKIIFTKKLNE